jgi:hypothetical protein
MSNSNSFAVSDVQACRYEAPFFRWLSGDTRYQK